MSPLCSLELAVCHKTLTLLVTSQSATPKLHSQCKSGVLHVSVLRNCQSVRELHWRKQTLLSNQTPLHNMSCLPCASLGTHSRKYCQLWREIGATSKHRYGLRKDYERSIRTAAILTDPTQATHRILSGVQPTNIATLGNYLGALKQFVSLQEVKPRETEHKNLFMIADLHSLTATANQTGFRKGNLKKNIYALTATFLACGLDPNKCILFQQSAVPEHAELHWILSTLTPLGQLKRMTQFKTKAAIETDKDEELDLKETSDQQILTGLLTYPILMAADVLLYRADAIPVGEDQFQHLELARTLAAKFNHQYKTSLFLEPKPLVNLSSLPKVMSLTDPMKKMSKSDQNDKSRINMTDSPQTIKKKVNAAVTDSFGAIDGLVLTDPRRKGIYNLVSIYAALKEIPSMKEALSEVEGKMMSEFKPQLTELLIEKVCPIGRQIEELNSPSNRGYLDSVLADGNRQARQVARETMNKVKRIIGL